MSIHDHVLVVDDDADIRDSLTLLLNASGYQTEAFESAHRFLAREIEPGFCGCLLADIRMPDMDGLELQEELVHRGVPLGVIIVTGHADVPLAVRAMKAGAIDFLEKPFDEAALLASVTRAIEATKSSNSHRAPNKEIQDRLTLLTDRERQVLELIMAGNANKVIAYLLSISPRTVELHRARLMDKMMARNAAELVRMTLPLVDLGMAPKTSH